MSTPDLPIAITLGDPAGIGPEIIAKAFRDAPELTQGCFVAGDARC
ncbi:MAG: 4-hydroxythreonine-4-phosphate dehydrogenase PdxA, partial [Comamonadaceae bacterium]